MPDAAASRLTALRNGLLHLHKCLLDAERSAYERDIQRITSRGQYLNLVLSDPWFAWLRDLSQFIVVVDEALADEQPVTPADAARLVARAREMVSPDEAGDGFRRHYFEAMQRDPEVVLAHRDMMRVFAEL
ncbi:MAG TPA: hypothetical protein VME43_02565 [Bryobacteraceae bacterium]|nr:hypothetical protein [Bryobacteraceae bacterium]